MGRRFVLPETYDGKILDKINGVPVKFITQSGRFICAHCANGNRNKVIDTNSFEWCIVDLTYHDVACDEHEGGDDEPTI